MSYNNNNNNKKFTNTGSNRPVYKSFCKVCQDAGKSETEYTNHNVRQTQDKNSPVTCPTLLAQECRNCFKKGHSSKYCPLTQGQQQSHQQQQSYAERPFQRPSERYNSAARPSYQSQSQSQSRPIYKTQNQAQEKRQAPKNVFMVFEEDEDDQEKKAERELKESQQRKLVPAPVAIKNQPAPFSFAKIIAVAPEVNKREEIKIAVALAAKEAAKPKPVIVLKEVQRINWATCESDSEGDDEEEEEDNSAW